MNVTILGGGLAAVTLAWMLQKRDDVASIEIIEKEDRLGGLCRSFDLQGQAWDIGPHILFSKNKAVLECILDVLGENKQQLRRSNRILHKGRLVQYPFENDLSKLPAEDVDYCVNAFMHNPYEHYDAQNMLQFFLKTFGEGITNLYLRPYNEKIWKFDPAYMDTQMVERIPKPPREDILKSAQGATIDGYTHQLYFHYPLRGGIQSVIDAFAGQFTDKVRVRPGHAVTGVRRQGTGFVVQTDQGDLSATTLVSTIPANLLCEYYAGMPDELRATGRSLRYNSIIIAIVNVATDRAGDNFAFMVADKNIAFHRLSKIDFLGAAYSKPGSATYMVEITYRKGDLIDQASDAEVLERIQDGLVSIGFCDGPQDICFSHLRRFEYAYVIYDLAHRRNMDALLDYFSSQGLHLHGRFGEFEYLNMDAVVDRSMKLAQRLT